jgi:hypothetical protein
LSKKGPSLVEKSQREPPAPQSGLILGIGIWGLKGWQWLFLCEGLPTVPRSCRDVVPYQWSREGDLAHGLRTIATLVFLLSALAGGLLGFTLAASGRDAFKRGRAEPQPMSKTVSPILICAASNTGRIMPR